MNRNERIRQILHAVTDWMLHEMDRFPHSDEAQAVLESEEIEHHLVALIDERIEDARKRVVLKTTSGFGPITKTTPSSPTFSPASVSVSAPSILTRMEEEYEAMMEKLNDDLRRGGK